MNALAPQIEGDGFTGAQRVRTGHTRGERQPAGIERHDGFVTGRLDQAHLRLPRPLTHQHILWPYAHGHRSGPGGGGIRQRDGQRADMHHQMPTAIGQTAIGQRHGRRADEPGNKHVGRAVVDLIRRRKLLQLARAHNRDAGRHGHRLQLIMGDIDHRLAQPPVQLDQFSAHVGAQRRIQIG